MQISELIEQNLNVTIAVSLNDLRAWHIEMIRDAKQQLKQEIDDRENETFLTPDEAATALGVNKSTLWRWNKSGYLKHIEAGGRRRYSMSSIKRISDGGRS